MLMAVLPLLGVIAGCRAPRVVTIDGISMTVPESWADCTPREALGKPGLCLSQQRFPFGVGGLVRLTDSPLAKDSWTDESAAKWQGNYKGFQKFMLHSDVDNRDYAAGRYKALCGQWQEERRGGMECVIVGTRLQYTYLGNSHLGEARDMLASLR